MQFKLIFKNTLKRMIPYRLKDLDAWTFLLLPIIVMLFFMPIVFLVNRSIEQISILLTQQLLIYSIIISTTDLGIKFKSSEDYNITPPLLLMLSSLISLACLYIAEYSIKTSISEIYQYLTVSIIITYFVILLASNNPEYSLIGPATFIKSKLNYEKKKEEEFKSKQTEDEFDGVKYGEKDE